MARLTSPQGATVEVRDDKVDGLLRMGFSQERPEPEKKAPAKKSAPSGSEK
jgi:hypothetical protein